MAITDTNRHQEMVLSHCKYLNMPMMHGEISKHSNLFKRLKLALFF